MFSLSICWKFFILRIILYFIYIYVRPEKVDFIRMAALMDAIIVPFSAIGMLLYDNMCWIILVICMYVYIIGMADSVDILLDSKWLIILPLLMMQILILNYSNIIIIMWWLTAKEISNLPLVGQGFRLLNNRIPQARIGGNETFAPPFVVPSRKGPARNYFLFQQVLIHTYIMISSGYDCHTYINT